MAIFSASPIKFKQASIVALMVVSLMSVTPAAAFDILEFFGFRQETIRYRLTLVYEKGGVEYRGSGVISAEYQFGGPEIPNVARLAFKWRGEALGVDIPGIGRVFALVIRPRQQTPSIISDACGLGSPFDLDPEEWMRRLNEEFTGICQVPADARPFFATFGNPTDPATLKVHTAETLPVGLVVKSATIERTDDEPTYGTTDILTWLGDSPYLDIKLTGQFFQDGRWKTSYHEIGSYSFREGAP